MAAKKKTRKSPTRSRAKTPSHAGRNDRPRCGLCGKASNLTRTECCGQWICDDEHKYQLFSFARNSCSRNHRRYTLCGFHHCEGHEGRWQDCPKCRADFELEMYVYYGTNEYNFEKLSNPPAFEPTRCSKCNRVISLSEDGYSTRGDEHWCQRCSAKEFGGVFR